MIPLLKRPVLRRPRFRLIETAAGFHFTLVAPNGEPILSSESYPDEDSALKGISAVKRYAVPARIVRDDQKFKDRPKLRRPRDEGKGPGGGG